MSGLICYFDRRYVSLGVIYFEHFTILTLTLTCRCFTVCMPKSMNKVLEESRLTLFTKRMQFALSWKVLNTTLSMISCLNILWFCTSLEVIGTLFSLFSNTFTQYLSIKDNYVKWRIWKTNLLLYEFHW